jgi:integrase
MPTSGSMAIPDPAGITLRWGELAGLQVGDLVSVPGLGLRLRRAVLAGGGGGPLYVDTLKNNRARTVPLVVDLVPIADRWMAGKEPSAWLFAASEGGPLRESVGIRLRWPPGSTGSGFTICGIPLRRCGWRLALTRRWCSGCWGTLRRR